MTAQKIHHNQLQTMTPSNPQHGMRINVFLAQAGIASRRGADELITRKKIMLNGAILTEPGVRIDPRTDAISYLNPNGEWEMLTTAEETVIYVLYKPRGFVTSLRPQGRDPIVRKLIPAKPRVFPVGRLDKESEGLLILTNDGDLAYTLTHPSTHIPKTYTVHCHLPQTMTEDTLKSYLGRLAKGVKIEGKRTLPADITFIKWLRPRMVEIVITLREGRNRQIRRMLGSLDIEVVRLIRTRIGKLSLDDVKLDHGQYKKVSYSDII